MAGKAKVIAMAVLLMAAYCTLGQGQVAPATILEIDLENVVTYFNDVSDVSKLTTDPNITTTLGGITFKEFLTMGDIVAVNGRPAKGIDVADARDAVLRIDPHPGGHAIADTERASIIYRTFEILNLDGTQIGSIMFSGLGGGSAPPGEPLPVSRGNFAVVGGTGAFLGARGQMGQAVTPQSVTARQASMAEDPANRRRIGGGRVRFIVQLIPLSRPEIVNTPGGPAVDHSNDFALVTASRPAAPGEVLSLFATGLGPTRPGVDPGKPFPASPLAAVNSPVEVTVNGRAAEVTAAVGYPGTVDSYQVNFRVPSESARGTATIQVTAAWITGPEVRIAVQ